MRPFDYTLFAASYKLCYWSFVGALLFSFWVLQVSIVVGTVVIVLSQISSLFSSNTHVLFIIVNAWLNLEYGAKIWTAYDHIIEKVRMWKIILIDFI